MARQPPLEQQFGGFQFDYERELLRLEQDLKDRTYRPGPYHTFRITVPKPRTISAAPFRDRVVHHALVNVLEPIFERRFIYDSYACRTGKGTHAALDRFQSFCARYRYVLQCDITGRSLTTRSQAQGRLTNRW